jgi:hypothetical protein
MVSSKLVVLAGAAGVLAATPAKRDEAACQAVVVSIIPALTALPTPDESLVSFLAGQTETPTVTDACVVPAVTGSMSDEYSSYMSSLVSFADGISDELQALITACSDVPEITSSFAALGATLPTAACEEYTWESNGEKVLDGNHSNNSTGSGNSSDSDNTSGDDEEQQGNDDPSAAGRTGVAVLASIFAAGLAAVAAL